MKTTKLVAVLGVATFATAILGTTMVQAAPASTEGSVEFVESDNQGIVDPTEPGPKPEVVVPPVDPGTGKPEVLPEIDGPDDNSSMVLFANLDFGTHKVTKVKANYSAQQLKTNVWKDSEGKDLLPTAFTGYGIGGVLPQFLQLRTTKDAGSLDVKAQLGAFKLLDGAGEVATGNDAKTLDITDITFTNVKMQDNTIAGSATGVDDFALSPTATAPIKVATFDKITTTNEDDETVGVGSIRSLIFGAMAEKTTGDEDANAAKVELEKDKPFYYNNGIQLNLPNSSNMQKEEKYKAVLTWTLATTAQP